ncbi:hypothetical protein ABG067_001071 [Albugo candida]|uniref:Uncharacterized protein n=1 Tax=Albugo candida TaxID=65357 RepID=A0A024GBT1_9STRA|nr:unnamed protein product [Albugo candida]|eukprot:CCI43792.1 unnamed protein product [Albugo candida]
MTHKDGTIRRKSKSKTLILLREVFLLNINSHEHSQMKFERTAAATEFSTAKNNEPLVDEETAQIDTLSRKLVSELTLLRDSTNVDKAHCQDQMEQHIRRTWQSLSANQVDKLFLSFLDHIYFYHKQRDEVRAVGENLATQLLEQQQALRDTCREKLQDLRALGHIKACEDAQTIFVLQQQVKQLQLKNQEHEQNLFLAMQKLGRLRRRGQPLRHRASEWNDQDPTWESEAKTGGL